MVNSLLDDKFGYFILWKYRNKLLCFSIDFFSLRLTKVVLLAFAPVLIMQIIDMVSDAAATKAPIAKLADKVSGVFVPVVILIAFITSE